MADNPLLRLIKVAEDVADLEVKHLVPPSLPEPLTDVDGNVVRNFDPRFRFIRPRDVGKDLGQSRKSARMELEALRLPCIGVAANRPDSLSLIEPRIDRLIESTYAVLNWQTSFAPDPAIDPALSLADQAEEYLCRLVDTLLDSIPDLEAMAAASQPTVAPKADGSNKRESSNPDDTASQYVTLDQMAALASRSKRTLEGWLKTGKLPDPDVEGGGGKPHLWLWAEVCQSLTDHSGIPQPERYPSLR